MAQENREFDKPENQSIIKRMLGDVWVRVFEALKDMTEKFNTILEEQRARIAEEKARKKKEQE